MTDVSAVEHVLPAMHGVSRAFVDSSTHWTASHMQSLDPIRRHPASETYAHLTSLLEGSFVHSSEDGRYVMNALARYESLGCAMTASFAALTDSRILRSAAVRVTAGGALSVDASWEALKTGSIKHVTATSKADNAQSVQFASAAQARMTHCLEEYLTNSEEYAIDRHLNEILRNNLVSSALCHAKERS